MTTYRQEILSSIGKKLVFLSGKLFEESVIRQVNGLS
jgi:hypothetical protein